MKKLITLILFILVSTFSFAQSTESMKIEADKIFKYTYELNYDKILDLTYPKIFDIIDRKMMKVVLKQTFEGNDEMSFKFNKVEPNFKFGEIINIGNQKFCIIKHDLSITLMMKDRLKNDEAELMLELFKASMETDDITYNKKERSFTINKIATMIAISDEITKNEWKFLNKSKNIEMFKKLLSEEVVNQLGL